MDHDTIATIFLIGLMLAFALTDTKRPPACKGILCKPNHLHGNPSPTVYIIHTRTHKNTKEHTRQ